MTIENNKKTMIAIGCPSKIELITEGVTLNLQYKGTQKSFIIKEVESATKDEEEGCFIIKGMGCLSEQGNKQFSFLLFFNPQESRNSIDIS